MRRALLLGWLGLSVACGQEIVVVECDGHVDGTERDGGQGDPRDAGETPDRDAGRDGGPDRDGGAVRDGGGNPGCPGSSPYCITGVVVSAERASVREAVTLTAEVDNVGGAALIFRAEAAEIVATRRAGLPPLVPADITLVLTVSGDAATFAVTDVPTWFSTTTFTIRLHAEAAGGPDVFFDADVTIVGNVVFADGSAVYAVTSDGAPATSVNFTFGRLLEGDSFVRGPADVLMARDGTLIVQDRGTSPQRLKRFELSGENVLLQEFEFEKGGVEFLDVEFAYGMTQLDDGRFVVLDTRFNRTPTVRFVLFGEEGSYIRTFSPIDTSVRYDGVAPGPNNTFYVCESNVGRRIMQWDPDTGTIMGPFATELASMNSITRAVDGSYYVGTEGTIARLSTTGARMMVNMVPGETFEHWEFLAPYGPNRIVGSTPQPSATENVVVVEGTTALGYLRQDSVGNPVRTPQGIAALE